MKNIEYLEEFFRKHNLSGRITIKYQNGQEDDDMTDIVFPDGNVININDVIFDIDSELVEDVFEQWVKSRKNNDISLMEWIQTNNHYTPKIDQEPINEYHREMDKLIDEVKKNINKVFELEVDESEDE